MLRIFAAVTIVSPWANSEILVVGPPGSGLAYESIQAAIEASTADSLILVRAGVYTESLSIAQPLTLQADAGGEVRIQGTLELRSLPPDSVCRIAGLKVIGATSQPALVVDGCEGVVRVERASFYGGGGHNGSLGTPGGHGAVILHSRAVGFAHCALAGGRGGGTAVSTGMGADGGDALLLEGSPVAVYACQLFGGDGGDADIYYGNVAGDGGAGCRIADFGAFMSGCSLRGGDGGMAHDPGDGGDGLHAAAPSEARLLEVELIPGEGGVQYLGGRQGDPGLPHSGDGHLVFLAGSARTIDAPPLALAGAPIELTVRGEAGDAVALVVSEAPAQAPATELFGLWLVTEPQWLGAPRAGLLDRAGTASIALQLRALAPGVEFKSSYVQVLVVDALGTPRLGSSVSIVSPSCTSAAADCNANGTFDSCELLAGSTPDQNANGFPDDCEPDCNGNGLPDDIDIDEGTSEDVNQNGIPDECETSGVGWHVDASAAPDGDGSSAAPFDELADAFETALPSDRVLLAPGVYSGPRNKNLDFGGRDFEVLGTGGAGSCVIDCERAGRAFRVRQGETQAARIEGLTIVNGDGSGPASSRGGAIYVSNASPIIAGCTFRSCETYYGGGAVYIEGGASVVRDCLFEDNHASMNVGEGGALRIQGGEASVLRCTFVANSASRGGALAIDPSTTPEPRVSHCRFSGNRARSGSGGALYVLGGQDALLWIDHALFAGNESGQPGSAARLGARTRMTSCTIVQNSSASDAVLYGAWSGASELELQNVVLFGNSSPGGHSIAMSSSSAHVEVAHSDLEGGAQGIALAPGATLSFGSGNLDRDPLFVDPDGPDGDPTTWLDNDWRLGPGSPCVDAGDHGALAPDALDVDGDGDAGEPVPLDSSGLPRRVDDPAAPDCRAGPAPVVDMGAHERQG